jgi:hypothetical protein
MPAAEPALRARLSAPAPRHAPAGGDATRLLHHAESVTIEGKSYRMKDKIEE